MNKNKHHKNQKSAWSKSLLLAGMLLSATAAGAQSKGQDLKGRIVDGEGNPIAGAVVNIAEQSKISLTDEKGYFNLKNVKLTDEICVSSVGYHNAQVAADFNGDFTITLDARRRVRAHDARTLPPQGQETRDGSYFGSDRRGTAEAPRNRAPECLHLHRQRYGDLRMVFRAGLDGDSHVYPWYPYHEHQRPFSAGHRG
jgi:hypothetical protein